MHLPKPNMENCKWMNIIIFYTYIVLLHDDYSTYTKPEGRGTVIQLVVRKIDGTTSKHLAAGTKINAQYTILSIKTSTTFNMQYIIAVLP